MPAHPHQTVLPQTQHFVAHEWVPNHPHLTVLIYQRVVTEGDIARQFEQRFAANGWPPQWRDGIFDYHHYHSTAHEVLGIAAGTARLLLGGPGGKEFDVRKGDVILLPAGTGHRRLSASDDFLVVGAYAPGQEPDLCKEAPDAAMLARIASLPFPGSDPVNGKTHPLTEYWQNAEK
ncbi:cupin [Superficieibacter electus]|uniref:Cupin n=1 Tax=Superficieibacter electus TaxID=2022662 RepID=A0A2P5GUE0_9ENTR|nr:cupin [Superficieibacter electus]POP47334.1 cupin [Superficieibacter electus]POP50181.1 cupin [Superficieibacter electus]